MVAGQLACCSSRASTGRRDGLIKEKPGREFPQDLTTTSLI